METEHLSKSYINSIRSDDLLKELTFEIRLNYLKNLSLKIFQTKIKNMYIYSGFRWCDVRGKNSPSPHQINF